MAFDWHQENGTGPQNKESIHFYIKNMLLYMVG